MKEHTLWLARHYFKWYAIPLDLVSMKRSQAEAFSRLVPEEHLNEKPCSETNQCKWISLKCSTIKKHAEN